MKRNLHIAIFLFLILALPSMSKGQTWEKIYTGQDYILTAIEFPDNQSQIGYTAGQSVTYNGDGIIMKTTDGGDTWETLWTGINQGIEGISFPTLDTGYAAGWNGVLTKTTDGGASWESIAIAGDVYYHADVVFKDAWNGILLTFLNSGGDDLVVYVTEDGGLTWSDGIPLPSLPISACYVCEDTYFIACWGQILKSTDNGHTWETKYSIPGVPIAGVRFMDESTGMAASEDGRILKTFDRGENWEMIVIADAYPLWRDFAWVDANTVYVSGTPEVIWKSTDGGINWNDDYLESTFENAIYEILCLEDGTLIASASQGFIFRKKLEVPVFYNIYFDVQDENQNIINDAIVIFDGVQNEAGEYSFEAISGNYDYIVSKEGYFEVIGQLIVESGDIVVHIQMILNDIGTGRLNQGLWSIYTNSENSMLYIQAPTIINEVQIYNLGGELLVSERMNTNNHKLNLGWLSGGCYIMKALTNEGVQTKKIIIAH